MESKLPPEVQAKIRELIKQVETYKEAALKVSLQFHFSSAVLRLLQLSEECKTLLAEKQDLLRQLAEEKVKEIAEKIEEKKQEILAKLEKAFEVNLSLL